MPSGAPPPHDELAAVDERRQSLERFGWRTTDVLAAAGIVGAAMARTADDVRRGIERDGAPEVRAGGNEGRVFAFLVADDERGLRPKGEVLAGAGLQIVGVAQRDFAHLNAFVGDLRARSEVAHDGVSDGHAVAAGGRADDGLTGGAAGEQV